MPKELVKILKKDKDWRDGREPKSTDCSSKQPGFNYQHSHGGSQASLIPVVGASVTSPCLYTWNTDMTMRSEKTSINIKLINNLFKSEKWSLGGCRDGLAIYQYQLLALPEDSGSVLAPTWRLQP